MALQSSLVFSVRRCKPELIPPAKPTPREFKSLSEIDDQDGYWFQFPVIQFYKNDPTMRGIDPLKVIREALAKALVFYYPFAGRLREGPDRKLIVDCNAEGVLFIEADADVSLEQFGDTFFPPFPCIDELLYDVPGSQGIVNCPLLLIQVTRLICGGFIVAVRLNHTMSDALGLAQFLTALGEIARGKLTPSVQPVWQRELLHARNPPRVTCVHHEFDDVAKVETNGKPSPPDQQQLVHRNFFFGTTEITALRKHVPSHLHKCSRFDLVTACLWRCRTVALQLDPDDEVRILFPVNVNIRSKEHPPLPVGFYGNAFVLPAGLSTAGELCRNPLGYALELVMKVKTNATDEYMRSLADLMVIKRRPHYTVIGSLVVSDLTRAGLSKVDFGWGKAVYGGPAKGDVGTIPGIISMHIPFKKSNVGEEAIVVPIYLPEPAMERFVEELGSMIGVSLVDPYAKTTKSGFIRSLL
ncbi:benzyl alcohol O-benzoyltransferase-like [Macadamia integrifolia]|uniref:benzyl alcohol O-benzoyltransferase-like n=1 Tax=Macadamia integrifolia TaxID=60698 RepID=UPI001C4E596E|nr:benzyl alcohol O-benzoyltransferase-like [Macadamia integrifolia]XP_042495626.1 benzyl alcohol O-benzoyltransferase-like [Macadamia integrifolia]